MDMQVVPFSGVGLRNEVLFDPTFIERIILDLGELRDSPELLAATCGVLSECSSYGDTKNMSMLLTVKEFPREEIILAVGSGDINHIKVRIVWNSDTAVLTSLFAVAGGIFGGYAGGRMGATLGAGIGGAAGLGISTVVSLRELWAKIKEQVQELIYIVFNFLQRLDHIDYIRAYEILMACRRSRTELVLTIIDFIAQKLGREVLSSITAG